MRKPNKENIILPENVTTNNETAQTPIEIALKIDENGMTKRRKIQ